MGVGLWPHVRKKVLAQDVTKRCRRSHYPPPAVLRFTEQELAIDLGRRLGNRDFAAQHIDVPPTKSDRLASTETAVSKCQNECSVSIRHAPGETVKLLRREEEHLTVRHPRKLGSVSRIRCEHPTTYGRLQAAVQDIECLPYT